MPQSKEALVQRWNHYDRYDPSRKAMPDHPDGFSLHHNEKDLGIFIKQMKPGRGDYPTGKPYKVILCDEQWLPMCSTPHGIRIRGDHPELISEMKKAYCQLWACTEPGNGPDFSRPDGYSLHLTSDFSKKGINDSYPVGDPYPVNVSVEEWEIIHKSDGILRRFDTPPTPSS